MLKRIEALPADLGKPETLLADNGYFSDANVALCAAAQIDPMIALAASRIIRPWRSALPKHRRRRRTRRRSRP